MLIVAINGSPNKDGNTVFLLNQVLEEAKRNGAEVELLHVIDALEDQDKPYCDACSSPCNRSCIDGTELEKAYDLLEKTDGLVIGSPVYFGTVSAQMKAFWDKSRCIRSEKVLIGKVGGAVAVGASRFGGQETTIRTLHDIMLIHGMNIIGDGSIQFDAGHQGVCGQRPAGEDKEAIKRAKVMGRRIVEEAQKHKNR
jgi:multimeric flavodoxin WrbA